MTWCLRKAGSGDLGDIRESRVMTQWRVVPLPRDRWHVTHLAPTQTPALPTFTGFLTGGRGKKRSEAGEQAVCRAGYSLASFSPKLDQRAAPTNDTGPRNHVTLLRHSGPASHSTSWCLYVRFYSHLLASSSDGVSYQVLLISTILAAPVHLLLFGHRAIFLTEIKKTR